MRLLRLRLGAVRGVAGCEVEFAPRGVTVVEGPNESGKTTLAEALDLLLDKLDSSTHRTVRALQPVGTDAGSEVEAEIEAGRYQLRIFKRFNRNRETVLQVYAPVAEDLTGGPAHDRLREILAESVDLDLWRALRVEQGGSLEQAALGEARSLLSALEGAAAGGAGAREEGLFERAREEYVRYFTPARGQPTGELKEAEERAVALRAEVALVEDELAQLETDVERHDRLRRRAAELAAAAERAERERAAAAGRLTEVEKLSGEVDRRRAAVRDEEGRLRLLRELDEAVGAAAELAGRVAAAERERTTAREALEPAEREAAEAERAVAAARAEVDAARAGERAAARGRLAAVAARIAELDQALTAHPVTEAALRDLEAKDRAAEKTAAALEAARAGVELEALAALEATVGGEPVQLAAGERIERPVAEPLAVELPGAARITVTPGRDVAELAGRAAADRATLAAACGDLGVESFAAAREAHRARRELESDRAAAEADRRELARSGAGEGDTKSAATAETTEAAEPLTPEQATAIRAEAEATLAAAEERLAPRAEARDQRRQAVERARQVGRELEIEQRHAGERLARAREGIGTLLAELAAEAEDAAAGGSGPGAGGAGGTASGSHGDPSGGETSRDYGAPDDPQLGLFRDDLERPELAPALAAAERRASAARDALAAARERLAEAEPEAVRRRAAELAESAARHRRELGTVEGELAEVRGRLAARGERGLFDRAADARAALAAAERQARALRRRAEAARKLFQALAEARDRARAAYGEPLRREIEELGRPLYGAGFGVELDDELRIARRSLDGITLDIEQLSAGAREQLALLARLACARLAAGGEGGGVPVILDDALGHTDPERLAALGPVLDRAAGNTQLIVLTSHPERYAAVPGARRVTLG